MAALCGATMVPLHASCWGDRCAIIGRPSLDVLAKVRLSSRSRLLRERIWIDKAAALAIIKTSEWASVRNPSSLSALLMSSFPGFSPERGILFDRFVELTLRNFSEKGDWAAREVDGAMQYEEHALREFLDNALSADAIKKFGDVPH